MASKVEVRVEPGLSPGLCEAAALAAPVRHADAGAAQRGGAERGRDPDRAARVDTAGARSLLAFPHLSDRGASGRGRACARADVGTTRYGLCSGFDPAFAQASPGRLLHYRNTEAAIARGIRLINWGCGDSGYKRQLGAVEGPRLLDCLLVRDLPGLVPLAQKLWRVRA
jgi:hypothetical protein